MDKLDTNHLNGKPTAEGEPPLGLIPKRFYEERKRVERFNQVCGAISRYYNAGLKINIEWVEEYNDLVVHCKNGVLNSDDSVNWDKLEELQNQTKNENL